jgi:hypothetical protein
MPTPTRTYEIERNSNMTDPHPQSGTRFGQPSAYAGTEGGIEDKVLRQGCPGVRSPAIKDWFQALGVQAGNFILAYPEPTVKQVWKALTLQKAFQQVLETPGAAEALQQPVLKPLLDMAAD